MSLHIALYCDCCNDELCDINITHNLTDMAKEAGLYLPVWRPEEAGIQKAADLIYDLRLGLLTLKGSPEYFKKYNPVNGWGSYNIFVKQLEELLRHCELYPNATVRACR